MFAHHPVIVVLEHVICPHPLEVNDDAFHFDLLAGSEVVLVSRTCHSLLGVL